MTFLIHYSQKDRTRTASHIPLGHDYKCKIRQKMAMCFRAATTHFSSAARTLWGNTEGGGAVLFCLEAKRRRRGR